MISLGVGLVLGLLVAQRLGVDGGGAWFIGAIGAALIYLLDCALLPIDRCWACKGKQFIVDKRGKMRERPCARCRRRRLIRRPGARLIGAKGRRE